MQFRQVVVLCGLLLSHVALFSLADYVFRTVLYSDAAITKRHVRGLFAVTFTSSASLMQDLVTQEIFVDQDSVLLIGMFDMLVTLLLIYIVLPVTFGWQLFGMYKLPAMTRAAGAIALLPPLWYIFYISGPVVGLQSLELTLGQLVTRMSVFGVTVVSVLSGYGAVRFPMTTITSLLVPLSVEEFSAVEMRLVQTCSAIADRKAQLCTQTFAPQTTSWFGSFFSESKDEEELAHQEVKALESVLSELHLTLASMTNERAKNLRAKTWIGRLLNAWGWIMSGY
jgi:hypothetical protein